jgi:transcriptional regulator of arginine metabolism
MSRNIDNAALTNALKLLLEGRTAHTQEQICMELEAQGFEVNQSKISRLLKKVNAIKVENRHGQAVYSRAREPAPPTIHTPLKQLILNVVANETLVVIFTSPGSASMVARMLDHHEVSSEILATIAGDDTIFVAPKTIESIQVLQREITTFLLE